MSKSSKPESPAKTFQPRSCWMETLAYISMMDRSEVELREKLKKKGFSIEDVENNIERAKSLGFLDEKRTARSALRNTLSRKGNGMARAVAGKRKLDAEVVKEVISDVLEELPSEEDRAYGMLAGKSKFSNLSDPAISRKAWAYLARNGFSSDSCKKALRRLQAEIDFDD